MQTVKTHEKVLSITNHWGKANQSHNEISPHTCQSGYQKINNKCWRRYGEKGTLMPYWWDCKLVSPLWKQYGALTGVAQLVGHCPQSKRPPVHSQSGYMPELWGSVPGWVHLRGNQVMFLSCIGVSLSLSFSFLSPLANKINK